MRAREALKLKQEIVQNGADPVAKKKSERSLPTFEDICERYLVVKEAYKRPGTLRSDRSYLDRFVLPRFGKLKLKAITREDVLGLHIALRETPVQANRVRALVSAIMTYAGRVGSDNPAYGVPQFHEEPRKMYLKREQLNALAKALDEFPDQNVSNALRLLVLTGSRKSEVLTAKWSDFDLELGMWTKLSHATKQKKTEHLTLHRQALGLLLSMRKHASGEMLFPDMQKILKSAWPKILKSAGLPWFHIQADLRHTFASHLVMEGVPLLAVGKLLGHVENSHATERYAHLAESVLAASVNKFPELPMLSSRVN